MRILIAAFAVSTAMLAAEQYTLWRAGELKSKDAALASKATPEKMANETLGKWPNSLAMLAHRKGNGEPEIHNKTQDFFIVQKGEADLVLGGEAVGAKTTAPNELRGGEIKGGQTLHLRPGDAVHIPAGMPHQLLMPKGTDFTYFVVKVDE
jgi:mannose-6-phosphate isomerase-like protein (cupin superfamily)